MTPVKTKFGELTSENRDGQKEGSQEREAGLPYHVPLKKYPALAEGGNKVQDRGVRFADWLLPLPFPC